MIRSFSAYYSREISLLPSIMMAYCITLTKIFLNSFLMLLITSIGTPYKVKKEYIRSFSGEESSFRTVL